MKRKNIHLALTLASFTAATALYIAAVVMIIAGKVTLAAVAAIAAAVTHRAIVRDPGGQREWARHL